MYMVLVINCIVHLKGAWDDSRNGSWKGMVNLGNLYQG